ncbi:hypothetical protein JTE90_012606, partial [Oedothorax gibbosus]
EEQNIKHLKMENIKAKTERIFTRSPSKRFARQPVPQVTREVLDSWEKKITKPVARINGKIIFTYPPIR